MNAPHEVLPRTVEVIKQGIVGGLHIGAQVYVSIDGEPVADFGIGEARRGLAMTNQTIMLWLSAVKPVGAVALAHLWEQGKLDLDDRVCQYIPEFGTKGKDVVTLRHILTHTAGFRFPEVESRSAGWDAIISLLCEAEIDPDWPPGRKAGYNPAATWHLLGEVVRRLDGRTFEAFVRETIFEPLGLDDCWIGLTTEHQAAYGERLGAMHARAEGSLQLIPWTYDEAGDPPRPGGSGYGPIRGLGRFYEMLLARGQQNKQQRDAARLLAPQTVESLTARHRTGLFDHTFEHVVDYGLGFVIDSKMYGVNTVPYGYGPHCSPRTFGHGGSQCSIGFCDPEHCLVVAWVCNGRCGEGRHQRRNRAINTAIYEDLGLAT